MISSLGAALRVVKYTVPNSRFFQNCFLLLLILLLVSSTHQQATICNGFWLSMAQKTWFGVRMCLMGVQSVKINFQGFKVPQSCASRGIPVNTKTSENTEELCNYANYTNGCNELLIGNRVRSFWIDCLFSLPETPSGGGNLHLLTQPKGSYRYRICKKATLKSITCGLSKWRS